MKPRAQDALRTAQIWESSKSVCLQDCPDSAPLNLPLLSVLACVQTASQQSSAAGDGWVWLEGKEGEPWSPSTKRTSLKAQCRPPTHPNLCCSAVLGPVHRPAGAHFICVCGLLALRPGAACTRAAANTGTQ